MPENIVVRCATIKPVVSVRNLGDHFDTHMSTRRHVDAVCKKSSFHLRCMKPIRPYIMKCVCHTLVIALIFFNLDYCNTLLLDLLEYYVTRLQNNHNRAARLVVLTPISRTSP